MDKEISVYPNREVSVYQNVELRKLPEGSLSGVIDILNENDAWKDMLRYIPKNPGSPNFEPKYTMDHVNIIENSSKESYNGRCRPCPEILFEEWGTSGQIRPTLNTVKEILIKAKLYRAADLVADLLNEPRPQRSDHGPERIINTDIYESTSFSVEDNNFNEKYLYNGTTKEMESHSVPNLPLLSVLNNNTTAQMKSESADSNESLNMPALSKIMDNSQKVIEFTYDELKNITYNFSRIIGSGGFGEVFFGEHPLYGSLAVKKTHASLELNKKLFDREVTMLSVLRHKNIVPIIGFSKDDLARCIVTEYIDNGSLRQNLDKKYLSEVQRISILLGTADGLLYLHKGVDKLQQSTDSSRADKLIHGDVKTDNIMLTRDLIPKLCDFGLAKGFDHTYLQVTTVIGTKAYMAPEWMMGTITQKIDIYSFGIVVLEVITGLEPIVKEKDGEFNIKHYIENFCKNHEFFKVLDNVVSNWTKADTLYKLANQCLHHDMHQRPYIDNICDTLNILMK